MNPNPKAGTQPHSERDMILTQLEEMWDRQIMKGDDDLLEQRDTTRSDKKTLKYVEHEEPKPERRRRRKAI